MADQPAATLRSIFAEVKFISEAAGDCPLHGGRLKASVSSVAQHPQLHSSVASPTACGSGKIVRFAAFCVFNLTSSCSLAQPQQAPLPIPQPQPAQHQYAAAHTQPATEIFRTRASSARSPPDPAAPGEVKLVPAASARCNRQRDTMAVQHCQARPFLCVIRPLQGCETCFAILAYYGG